MRKEKAIGYDLINVLWHNMPGFQEFWNKSEVEVKDGVVNGIGDLAYKLLTTDEPCEDDCRLNHCCEVGHKKHE